MLTYMFKLHMHGHGRTEAAGSFYSRSKAVQPPMTAEHAGAMGRSWDMAMTGMARYSTPLLAFTSTEDAAGIYNDHVHMF